MVDYAGAGTADAALLLPLDRAQQFLGKEGLIKQIMFPKIILPGTFDFGFATGLSYKDVRLCIDEAEAMGVPMVAGAAVRQMLAVTQARFGANSTKRSSKAGSKCDPRPVAIVARASSTP